LSLIDDLCVYVCVCVTSRFSSSGYACSYSLVYYLWAVLSSTLCWYPFWLNLIHY